MILDCTIWNTWLFVQIWLAKALHVLEMTTYELSQDIANTLNLYHSSVVWQ